MLLLRYLFDFVKLLHSETSTRQLSWGFVMGLFLGFTPITTLHWVIYWVLLLVLRINIGAALLGFATFSAIAFFLDPIFHTTGLTLLTKVPSLTPLWVSLYHAPIIPYTRFNNTVVLGSFVLALLCLLPLYILSGLLIRKYRDTVVHRIKNSHFAKAVMATKAYRLYAKYQTFKS